MSYLLIAWATLFFCVGIRLDHLARLYSDGLDDGEQRLGSWLCLGIGVLPLVVTYHHTKDTEQYVVLGVISGLLSVIIMFGLVPPIARFLYSKRGFELDGPRSRRKSVNNRRSN